MAYVDVDTLGGIPEKTTDDTTKERRPLLPSEITKELENLVNSQKDQPLPRVTAALTGSGGRPIQPAQLAFLTPDVPDTLILEEITA